MLLKLLSGWIPCSDDEGGSDDSGDNSDAVGDTGTDGGSADSSFTDTLKLFEEPDKFLQLIPQEYHKKGYMKGVSSMDALMKKLDGSQAKLGEKNDFAFPSEDATPEQLSEFRTKAGVPDEPTGYEFNRPEGFEETELTKKYEDGLRSLFHKAHISKDQAKLITEGQDGLIKEVNDAVNQEFAELANSTFGDKKEAVLKVGKTLLVKHAPKGFESHIANLGNKELILISGVLNSIASEYMNSDKLPEGDPTYTGRSLEELDGELTSLVGHAAYHDPSHKDHKSIHLKARQISKQMALVEKRAKNA